MPPLTQSMSPMAAAGAIRPAILPCFRIKVSLLHWLALSLESCQAASDAFGRIDADGSGGISREEFAKAGVGMKDLLESVPFFRGFFVSRASR